MFGTYATIFPGSVGLMILDGNVNPLQNLEIIAHGQGEGENTRISYGLYSCSARNAEEPGSCPVDDLPKCVSDVSNLLQSQLDIQVGDGQKEALGDFIQTIYTFPDRAQEFCDLAESGDFVGLNSLYVELVESLDVVTTRQIDIDIFNTPSGPTLCEPGICNVIGMPDYEYLGDIVTSLVNVQDAFSGGERINRLSTLIKLSAHQLLCSFAALYDADYFAKRKTNIVYSAYFEYQ